MTTGIRSSISRIPHILLLYHVTQMQLECVGVETYSQVLQALLKP